MLSAPRVLNDTAGALQRCSRAGLFSWQRFPLYWCILSHSDEDVARLGCGKLLGMLDVELRDEALDAYIVSRRNNVQLLTEMRAFRDGTARWAGIFLCENNLVATLLHRGLVNAVFVDGLTPGDILQ